MLTIEKIKNKALEIARLGAVLSSPYGPTAKKDKGILRMSLAATHPVVLTCDLRSGRVWEEGKGDGTEEQAIPEPHAFERLIAFDRAITEAVRRQLREEVLSDLVEKRLRRITRAKKPIDERT